ncbi:hypothetical protein ACV3J8_14670 [Salmonella enterica]|nr:hypothetical protein [Salmonella enterica subsp. enterica]
MGWLFSHISRAELIRELTRPEENKLTHRETLKYTLRGNVLWSVVRFTAISDTIALKAGQSTAMICCDLLQRSGDSWGYKSLSEDDSPFYYSCPLSYLSLAPVSSASWRESVRVYHDNRKRRAK